MPDYKKNNCVYFISKSSPTGIYRGLIKSLNDDQCLIDTLSVTYLNGETDDYIGMMQVPLADLYSTCEAAYKHLKSKHHSLIMKYCSEIKDLPDLIAFPFDHFISAGSNRQAESYVDFAARTAYRIRSEEIQENIQSLIRKENHHECL